MRFDSERAAGGARQAGRFVLYVEGPGDRAILRAWSYRLLPAAARDLFSGSVILGGRRPARALAHFRGLGGREAGARALCVLDRDDGAGTDGRAGGEPGLEIFTWSRRHIESYLLVPAAIRRALGQRGDDVRLERVLRDHLPPPGDEAAFRQVDAKRLLGRNGTLPRAIGRPLPLGGIARATREAELHRDVHELFARLRRALDIRHPVLPGRS